MKRVTNYIKWPPGHLKSRGPCCVFWNSSCDVGGLIADGSSCRLMSDDHVTLDISCYQWADNICPVNFLVDRAESVLSW